jgi:hypothetical protein
MHLAKPVAGGKCISVDVIVRKLREGATAHKTLIGTLYGW